jgi:EAL domain-containing protein (putative c-di-GMP-specific phosphodiesterase class I)
LKIDQSFVHNLSDNSDDAAITISIINLGQSLKLRVIAEGVETAEDLAFLDAHDCDEAQGFYLSPPVSAEQCAHLLSRPSFCLTS